MYDVIISFTGILLYKHKSQAVDILDAGMHVSAACPQQLIVFGGDELLHPVTVLAEQCLDQRQLQSVTLHNCRAIIQEQRAIPQQRIRTLVPLMQRRVAACVTPRGGPTSYLTCCMHIYYSTGSIKLMPNFAFLLLNSTFGVDCACSPCACIGP